jgi:hypothetical protein
MNLMDLCIYTPLYIVKNNLFSFQSANSYCGNLICLVFCFLIQILKSQNQPESVKFKVIIGTVLMYPRFFYFCISVIMRQYKNPEHERIRIRD